MHCSLITNKDERWLSTDPPSFCKDYFECSGINLIWVIIIDIFIPAADTQSNRHLLPLGLLRMEEVLTYFSITANPGGIQELKCNIKILESLFGLFYSRFLFVWRLEYSYHTINPLVIGISTLNSTILAFILVALFNGEVGSHNILPAKNRLQS